MKQLNNKAVSVVSGGALPSFPLPGGGTFGPTGGVTHPGPGGHPWGGVGITFRF